MPVAYGWRMGLFSRLDGDPSAGRWLRYAIGLRLPPENSEWVRHDLTDAGWRLRGLSRQLVFLVPIAAAFVALPGPLSDRIYLVLLVLIGGLFVGLVYGDSLRASRLRQHGLPVPTDRDLGRPTDS
jgi:hypothetical protein